MSIYVKGFKTFFAFDLCISVSNKAHCNEWEKHEDCGVDKQHSVAYFVDQKSRNDRCNYLRRHTKGIVKTRKFTHVASVAHLNDHREAIYVDRSPSNSDERE